MSSRIAARAPQAGAAPRPEIDNLDSFLDDAAHYPGGHARGVVRPRSTDEITACLRRTHRILPIGAQSSLTGGATPFGDVVLSTDRLNSISIAGDQARVDAGATLQSLQDALARSGRWFPPVPTYLGAFAGGAVATCAAGAATFKYGTVRDWVEGLTIVLAGGDVLTIARGECVASEEGIFEIETSTGVRVVRIPDIRMPDVAKRSAGYFLKPGMDLVDLFIGSEGTLGVIAQVIFRTASKPAAVCRALVPVPTEALAIALTGELRLASQATWRARDPRGIDVAAIEHLDARSIAVIREDGIDRKLEVALPSGAAVVLLIDLEVKAERQRHDQREGQCEQGQFELIDGEFNHLIDSTTVFPPVTSSSAARKDLNSIAPSIEASTGAGGGRRSCRCRAPPGSKNALDREQDQAEGDRHQEGEAAGDDDVGHEADPLAQDRFAEAAAMGKGR